MRKILVALAAAVLGLSLAATPALAARDPFHPLVSSTTAPSSGSSTTAGSQTASGTTSGSAPTNPVQPVDGTPNTGFNASEWIVLALTLMLLGGGLFLIERLLRPAPFRPRHPSL